MVNNTHDHPMIINQMQDPSSVSKIGESKLMDVLTPKSGVREFRGLKTDQSAKSQCESNPRGISTNDSSNLNINKNNSFLKSKVAYDFNPKEFFVHSEKRTSKYQMKFEIQKQRAFIDKLTNNTMIATNLYQKFNALSTDEGLFDRRVSGGNLNTSPGEKPSKHRSKMAMSAENAASLGVQKDK